MTNVELRQAVVLDDATTDTVLRYVYDVFPDGEVSWRVEQDGTVIHALGKCGKTITASQLHTITPRQ